MADGELRLPRARVKRIMKADDDLKQIKPETVLVVAKAAELFVSKFANAGHAKTQAQKRKILTYPDLVKCVSDESGGFDFLTDFITARRPGSEESEPERKKHKAAGSSASAASAGLDDIWLPATCVKRVVKDALPDKITCEQDAHKGLVRAGTIFVSYLTACAFELSQRKKTGRNMLTLDDVYKGIDEIGESGWRPELQTFVLQAEKTAAETKKAAPSGFIKFTLERREKVKEGNPQSSLGDIAKTLGKMWHDLTDEQKAEYKAVKE